MTLAVYLQQSFIVGFDDVDVEGMTFGALGMKRATAVLVIAWNSHPQHVSTERTVVDVLPSSID
jgi:hypothetical protein